MDLLRALSQYGIEYRTTGKNVRAGNVNIKCPFCGPSDPSEHMGINPDTGVWGCWRDRNHRGKGAYKLIARIARVSVTEARRATGEGAPRALEEGDFDRAVSALETGDDGERQPPSRAKLPKECESLAKAIRDERYSSRKFVSYLVGRGFDPSHIHDLAKRYDLHYAISGKQRYRVVMPVYERGELICWTGRSILQSEDVRYLASPNKYSVKPIKHCVYNYDSCMEGSGRVLFVVEGPFDVLKMDFYGRKYGARAVGLFNMNVERAQLPLMQDLAERYKKLIYVLDSGETAATLHLERELSHVHNGVVYSLPSRFKDPGAMSANAVKRLCMGQLG
jgi:hypothetical protein